MIRAVSGPPPALTIRRPGLIFRASVHPTPEPTAMKVRNSLKSAKTRDRNCVIVRRRGRVYVINKRNKRFKARQG